MSEIITRQSKGAPLSFEEMDNNLILLDSKESSVSTGLAKISNGDFSGWRFTEEDLSKASYIGNRAIDFSTNGFVNDIFGGKGSESVMFGKVNTTGDESLTVGSFNINSGVRNVVMGSHNYGVGSSQICRFERGNDSTEIRICSEWNLFQTFSEFKVGDEITVLFVKTNNPQMIENNINFEEILEIKSIIRERFLNDSDPELILYVDNKDWPIINTSKGTLSEPEEITYKATMIINLSSLDKSDNIADYFGNDDLDEKIDEISVFNYTFGTHNRASGSSNLIIGDSNSSGGFLNNTLGAAIETRGVLNSATGVLSNITGFCSTTEGLFNQTFGNLLSTKGTRNINIGSWSSVGGNENICISGNNICYANFFTISKTSCIISFDESEFENILRSFPEFGSNKAVLSLPEFGSSDILIYSIELTREHIDEENKNIILTREDGENVNDFVQALSEYGVDHEEDEQFVVKFYIIDQDFWGDGNKEEFEKTPSQVHGIKNKVINAPGTIMNGWANLAYGPYNNIEGAFNIGAGALDKISGFENIVAKMSAILYKIVNGRVTCYINNYPHDIKDVPILVGSRVYFDNNLHQITKIYNNENPKPKPKGGEDDDGGDNLPEFEEGVFEFQIDSNSNYDESRRAFTWDPTFIYFLEAEEQFGPYLKEVRGFGNRITGSSDGNSDDCLSRVHGIENTEHGGVNDIFGIENFVTENSFGNRIFGMSNRVNSSFCDVSGIYNQSFYPSNDEPEFVTTLKGIDNLNMFADGSFINGAENQVVGGFKNFSKIIGINEDYIEFDINDEGPDVQKGDLVVLYEMGSDEFNVAEIVGIERSKTYCKYYYHPRKYDALQIGRSNTNELYCTAYFNHSSDSGLVEVNGFDNISLDSFLSRTKGTQNIEFNTSMSDIRGSDNCTFGKLNDISGVQHTTVTNGASISGILNTSTSKRLMSEAVFTNEREGGPSTFEIPTENASNFKVDDFVLIEQIDLSQKWCKSNQIVKILEMPKSTEPTSDIIVEQVTELDRSLSNSNGNSTRIYNISYLTSKEKMYSYDFSRLYGQTIRGVFNTVYGRGSEVSGVNNIAANDFMTVAGTSNVGTNSENIYEFGIGSPNPKDNIRKNGFEITFDGCVSAPESIPELIADCGEKTLITKEYSNLNGDSRSRPNGQIGQFYFDTDLNMPIWYNGTHWVDATGTER